MRGFITNISQQNAIQNIANYNALFHPSYLNNYNIELVNKSQILDKLMSQKRDDLQKLNIASYNLCAFCGICALEMSQQMISSADEIIKLNEVLAIWKELIKRGSSFATYDYAKLAIEIIIDSGFPLLEKLFSSKYHVIIDAFRNIPEPAKAFLRLNSYSRKDDRTEMLTSLFDFFSRNPDIFEYVERVEIAKDEMAIDTFGDEEYPVFSIFFDYNALSNRKSSIIRGVIEHIKLVEASQVEGDTPYLYAFQVTNSTTLSQGYKNYKRYLELMNVISTVYDKETNYAFINDKN